MYPRVVINLDALKANLDKLNELCHSQSLTTAIVTKVFCADEKITELIENSYADMFADSRLENLEAIHTSKPKLLLRIGMRSEAKRIVQSCDISMQSELSTVFELNQAAKKLGKMHKCVLMIDLGDLREGIFFKNRDEIIETARQIHACSNIELFGIGTNLTCYGGILPDNENLGVLSELADSISNTLGIKLSMVSGGNSSTMTMLSEKRVPAGITNLRLGESFVLGNDTSTGDPMEGFATDSFILEAEIVELKRKPSKPIGKCGPNAFGEYPVFEDKGEMVRAICAVGRQDTDPDSLTPVDDNISIVGSSSDHLIVDLTQAHRYNVGDVIRFTPGYGALLRMFTSRYVKRVYTSNQNKK